MLKNKSINDFFSWTKLKVGLHFSERQSELYFKEREIWWTSLGLNIGHEEDGKNKSFERPVLILKVFNKEVLWILPLTSKEKKGKYYYQFEYKSKRYSVILSQLRLISSKRLLRKIRIISKEDFVQIKEKVRIFL